MSGENSGDRSPPLHFSNVRRSNPKWAPKGQFFWGGYYGGRAKKFPHSGASSLFIRGVWPSRVEVVWPPCLAPPPLSSPVIIGPWALNFFLWSLFFGRFSSSISPLPPWSAHSHINNNFLPCYGSELGYNGGIGGGNLFLLKQISDHQRKLFAQKKQEAKKS